MIKDKQSDLIAAFEAEPNRSVAAAAAAAAAVAAVGSICVYPTHPRRRRWRIPNTQLFPYNTYG